jgi:uncharacterized protein
MRISGTSRLAADPPEVWRALNDPAVLVRTIPGCRRLEALGEDAYAMTVAAGVGSIKGVYDGEVHLLEQQEPGSFRMQARGAGAPGTIGADVRVTLEASGDGGTELTYDADATVGGMIGGVGQRMLVGVSKRMAAEFFGNVEAVMAGSAAAGGAPAESTGSTASTGSVGSAGGAPYASGAVFTAPPPASRGPGFAAGVVVGAAAALAGALVGAWVASSTRRPHAPYSDNGGGR